jgi:hypothetical protein
MLLPKKLNGSALIAAATKQPEILRGVATSVIFGGSMIYFKGVA